MKKRKSLEHDLLWRGPTVPSETDPMQRWQDQMRHHKSPYRDKAPIVPQALADKLVPKLCRCEKPYPYTDEDGTVRCLTCAKAIA